jgi:hypothetical protein
MSVCPVVPSDVTLTAVEQAGLGLLGGVGMVAVRLGDLRSPAGAGLGRDGRTALVAAGAGRVRTGDVMVFCKPVAVARVVVRRDGRVQAGGHPADHVRLGVAEQQLDALTGTPGLIEQVAGSVSLRGEKVKGKARRAMTCALAIRFTLLMTVMPDADYPEVLAALLGDLAVVPWQRPYRVPAATVLSTWRQAVGPQPLEQLRDRLLAAIDAEHHERDYRAVWVGELKVGSIDGSLVRTPDTPANRLAFGSAGTADDSAPYPQLRELRLADASTRATLAVVSGPSGAAAGGERDKGEAEQVLLDKALTDCPGVFTPDRVWVMDRNFPGVPRIARMLATGTHVLIRLKDGITLPRAGDLPRTDGDTDTEDSYLATISGGGTTLVVRVVEYFINIAGTDTGELFCLITDLLDPIAYPAKVLAETYHWRWIGSETTLKEAKSTINGAGPSTGAILRSGDPALIAQEHAAWTTTVELIRALARAAAATAAPAVKGRRAGKPVQPRQISFTAARRAVITTTRTGAATASLPTPLATANHHATLTELAHRRITIDRNRHRERKTKARPGFPHAGPHPTTTTAPAEIHLCKPPTAA